MNSRFFASSVSIWEGDVQESIRRLLNLPLILPNLSRQSKSPRAKEEKEPEQTSLLKIIIHYAKVDGWGSLSNTSRSLSVCIGASKAGADCALGGVVCGITLNGFRIASPGNRIGLLPA